MLRPDCYIYMVSGATTEGAETTTECIERQGTNLGYEVKQKYDTWKQQLFIDTRYPFPRDDYIIKVDMCVGATNRSEAWSPQKDGDDRKLYVNHLNSFTCNICIFTMPNVII